MPDRHARIGAQQDTVAGGRPAGSAAPQLALPKGGGAIRGIGEKFSANPATGSGSMSVPIVASPGRSGSGPQLSLSYDAGTGNGPFGFGWRVSIAAVTRKTDKGLPQYLDAEDSDTFVLSGAEDLVPVYRQTPAGVWIRDADGKLTRHEEMRDGHVVRRYRPRVEGLFAIIERWSRVGDAADVHWRSISRDNVLTLYGFDADSRIQDPAEPGRIFSWLICQTRDDKGNVVQYAYKPEDGAGVDTGLASERNRGPRDAPGRTANRYLKRVRYGNRIPLLDAAGRRPVVLGKAELGAADWMFELVFDYHDHDPADPKPDDDAARDGAGELVRPWTFRRDPFSVYRSGFEVRTTRLCRRVLMFHHFPGEAGVGRDCLVRSTDLLHSDEQNAGDPRNPVYAFLLAVSQTGYRRIAGGYERRSTPPLEFTYSQPAVQDNVRDVDADSLENLPVGVDGALFQWIDLHGEGTPGILTEQASAWLYKRNVSPIGVGLVEFSPLELVATKPNVVSAGGAAQVMDLAGDGSPDLVVLDGPAPGLFEHDHAESWQPFRAFTSQLTHDVHDPNLRFVDLDGDGRADVLITEDDAIVWHASLGEAGFGPAQRIGRAPDEEEGPHLVFADGTQSVYLADLSGDGLPDLVRIRNGGTGDGGVCYWPNLGYGRFGAKVAMDGAPRFDNPGQFDQRRIRLADIDGSGTTDIVYLHRDGVRLYFNQSGNGWSAPHLLDVTPRVDDLAAVAVTDLLGSGCACLVWSSPLPNDAQRQMRYVDLVGGVKPHLLVKTTNNLGAETHVQYAPSTRFYQRDKRAGRPWITKLPFPVHVVERVETIDHVSRSRFVSHYAYHHGYFDPDDRDFRGFGMVEQWDTEQLAALSHAAVLPAAANLAAESHVPPVHTKTWFHTGVYLGMGHVSDFFAGLLNATDRGEYFREPGLSDAEARALLLPDTPLPPGLSVADEREACRALKGAMLRQEVYAADGSARQSLPYSVTEQNFAVRLLQPLGDNRHGVAFVEANQTIADHCERDPADPRTQHTLTLEVDAFGNVLKSAAVAYGRRATIRQLDAQGKVQTLPNPGLNALAPADRLQQTTVQVVYTENRFTNAVDDADAYHAPLPCESRSFELTGYAAGASAGRFQASDFVEPDPGAPGRVRHRFANEVAYEGTATGVRCRRVIDCERTLYRRPDLAALLPLGQSAALVVRGESYRLAFTPGLLARVFDRARAGQPAQPLLPDPGAVLPGQTGDRGGYLRSQSLKSDGRFPNTDPDDHWWVPSGRSFFSTNQNDGAAAELAEARRHFFLERRWRDPFGSDTRVAFDASDLLVVQTEDALGNRVTADASDYRVLQPALLRDPNDNRMAVAFDAMGAVAGTAVMGKVTALPAQGDSLAGFSADLSQAQIDALHDAADPHASATALLQDASSRVVYDLHRFRRSRLAHPNDPAQWLAPFAATLARETHASDPLPPQGLRILIGFSYSDGFGREIQKKLQAERGTTGPSAGAPRWVVSGWTIFNNKGKPVRQYEPFFSASHHFEFGVLVGVSPVLFYDPAGRVVATLHPNHTWDKVLFDPWRQETWDATDTVLVGDPATDPDVGDFFRRLPQADYLPGWHAMRIGGALGANEQAAAAGAAVHAGTPTVAHADALGRTFLTIAHDRFKHSDAAPGAAPSEALHATRIVFDIEGNQREVVDAMDRVVARHDHDLLGNRIHRTSMEAGARWMVPDAAGNPLQAWDSMDRRSRVVYDALRRPARTLLREGGAPEVTTGDTVHGESVPNAAQRNMRGKVVQVRDQAGVVTSDDYDFKGNLLRSRRQLAADYKGLLDWSIAVPLEAEIHSGRTRYDALNRAVQSIAPHSGPGAKVHVVQPTYNEGNVLEQVHVWLKTAAEPAGLLATGSADLQAVARIERDAKGQRTLIELGNGAVTTSTHDPSTFRLTHLRTRRAGVDLQNLDYVYDPVGNVTHIGDAAQPTIFFNNQRVDATTDFVYDALYRLIEATGREHLGQAGAAPSASSYDDAPRCRIPFAASDGNAMGRYRERYVYDAAGNIQTLQHVGSDPVHPGWQRTFTCAEASQTEAGRFSNRLTRSVVNPALPEVISSAGDGYDAHGNMLRVPQLQELHWDFADRLRMTRRQRVNALDADGTAHDGERTWYVYDAAGQRVRKVTELASGAVKDERVYLGGFEIYRKGGVNSIVRETLHILDDQQRVALIELRAAGAEPGIPEQLFRYQFGNHLGSAALELDQAGRIVSYEEYTPYGSTSFQAVGSQTEAPKRYRYTGNERDEESGLYYHGARYYAAWLARWTSCDPAATREGLNAYCYVRNNPILSSDSTGNDTAIAIPGAGGPLKEAVIVEMARQQGWKASGFKGYDDKGAAIFQTAEPLRAAKYSGPAIGVTPKDQYVVGRVIYSTHPEGGTISHYERGTEAQLQQLQDSENLEASFQMAGNMASAAAGVGRGAAANSSVGAPAQDFRKTQWKAPTDGPRAGKSAPAVPPAPPPPAALQTPPGPAARLGERSFSRDVDQKNDFVTRDASGRLLSITGVLDREHLGTGTRTTPEAREAAQLEGIFDAGHVRANRLGGLGEASTTFPQLPGLNRGQFRVFEKQLSKLVRDQGDSDTLIFNVQLKYSGTSNVPTEIRYNVRINGATVRGQFFNDRNEMYFISFPPPALH